MTIPFVNSLPKSGTNLVQKLIELLGYRYDRLGIAESLIRGRWFLARQLIRGACFDPNPIIVGLDAPMAVGSGWLDRRLGKVADRSYISGHANYTERLHYYLKKNDVRTIQVIRDPRDVLVSHAHFFAKKRDYFLHELFSELSFDDRVEATLRGGRFLNGKLHLESFSAVLSRVDPWVSQSFDDVLVIRFEDLVGVHGGGDRSSQIETIQRIGRFLGWDQPLHEEEMARLTNELFGGTHTFRKGKIGSWREELSASQQEVVGEQIGPFLAAWGYDA